MPSDKYKTSSIPGLGINKLHCVVVLLLMLFATNSYAAGVPAATVISSQARVDMTISGSPISLFSNTASIIVDELLEHSLNWQDTSNVVVGAGQANAVLTYQLTNNGNGSEAYSLSVNNTAGGDIFDPAFTDIYIDNGDGVLNTASDTLLNPGINDPTLAADASQIIFVRNNIPAGLSQNDTGFSILNASPRTGTGPVATTYDCDGTLNNGIDGGDGCINPTFLVDAIIGNSTGTQSVTGIYVVNDVNISINKNFAIRSPSGGNEPVTGATITYTLTINISGSGSADNVIVTDSICSPGPYPTCGDTSYVPGSLRLDGVSLSDANDADAGNYNDPATTNLITVDLGSVTAATPTYVITFDAIIN